MKAHVVADEDVVLDGDALADEGVAAEILHVAPDPRPALISTNAPTRELVADLALVEVHEVGDADVLAQRDVADLCAAARRHSFTSRPAVLDRHLRGLQDPHDVQAADAVGERRRAGRDGGRELGRPRAQGLGLVEPGRGMSPRR